MSADADVDPATGAPLGYQARMTRDVAHMTRSMAHDIATIRAWMSFFGVLAVMSLTLGIIVFAVSIFAVA